MQKEYKITPVILRMGQANNTGLGEPCHKDRLWKNKAFIRQLTRSSTLITVHVKSRENQKRLRVFRNHSLNGKRQQIKIKLGTEHYGMKYKQCTCTDRLDWSIIIQKINKYKLSTTINLKFKSVLLSKKYKYSIFFFHKLSIKKMNLWIPN